MNRVATRNAYQAPSSVLSGLSEPSHCKRDGIPARTSLSWVLGSTLYPLVDNYVIQLGLSSPRHKGWHSGCSVQFCKKSVAAWHHGEMTRRSWTEILRYYWVKCPVLTGEVQVYTYNFSWPHVTMYCLITKWFIKIPWICLSLFFLSGIVVSQCDINRA